MTQFDLLATTAVQLWTAAAGPTEEPIAVDGMEFVGCVEGGGDEGDVGVARWLMVAGRRQAVEPAGVDLTVGAPPDGRGVRAGMTCSSCRRG